MPTSFLIALGAGLVSAALYAAVATGAFGALLLAYLAPLPLFMVGLSLGLNAALTATAAALAVIVLGAGSLAVAAFVLGQALPALLVVWRSLISRTDASGTVQWYPPGLMLSWLAGTALALFAVAVVVVGSLTDGLHESIEQTLRVELERIWDTPAGPGTPAMDVDALASAMALIFPGIAASLWFVTAMVNGAIAQWALMRWNRNLRPPMRLAEVELPHWMGYGLGGAALVGLAGPGLLGFIGINAAIILSVPFVILGLAVLHALVAGKSWRIFALVLAYASMVFFGWPVLLLIILGLVDTWAGLRRRLDAPGPDV